MIVALTMQLDVLGAVAMGAAKAQGVQHGADRLGLVAVVDELEELDALQSRGGCLPAGPASWSSSQRNERMPSIAVCRARAGAEIVAEDLVADRPAHSRSRRSVRIISTTGRSPWPGKQR